MRVSGASSSPSIGVRTCKTPEEYAACVRLQSATWGEDYRDVVTPSLLKVSQRVGGVVAGAFLETGEMVGFVFGLTGVAGGRVVHWSHMLAVAAGYRDRGVGRRLKEHQRSVLRGLGVERAYWTFDPLVARNAHLNLNRLAVRLEEYAPEMYAETGSELHAFGTDRLVVSWPVPGDGAESGGAPDGRWGAGVGGRAWYGWPDGAPVVNVADGEPLRVPRDAGGPVVRIEIPSDIEGLLGADLEGLRLWRASTRAAFLAYLGRGYRARCFERGEERGWYVLEAGGGG